MNDENRCPLEKIISARLGVLLIADSAGEFSDLLSQLGRGGFDPIPKRVETSAEFEVALAEGGWDLVIASNSTPALGISEALGVLRKSDLDLPFLVMGAHGGNEDVLGALKAGAHDFFTQGELSRIAGTVRHELREAERRRASQRADRKLRDSEAELRLAFCESAAGMMCADAAGKITRINPKCCQILGCSEEQLLGHNFEELTFLDEQHEDLTYRAQIEAGVIDSYTMDRRYLRQDGNAGWVNLAVSIMRNANGHVDSYFVVIGDVTARKSAQQAAEAREQAFAAAQRITHLGTWELALFDPPDPANTSLSWSEETYRIFGYEPGAIQVSHEVFLLAVHPDDRARVQDATMRALKDGTAYSVEYRIIRPDGSERVVHEMADFDYDQVKQTPRKIVGTVQDITDRGKYQAQIEHLATHDGLTGLPNRNLLNDRIAQLIANAARTQGRIALLFLDIDRFKFINDSFGHFVGDILLKEVAFRLGRFLRDGDTVARLGGDEFVAVLANIKTAGDAGDVAHKLIRTLGRPFFLEGRELHITSSIGITVYPEDGDNGEKLLRNADAAMYRAKDRGRDRFEFYAREMSVKAKERVELESALHRAIENQEFELYYQPQVDLNSGAVRSVEALLRWRHPKFGMLAPARFIPLAEETGLILPIGEWVLKTACARAEMWHSSGSREVSIAVNLSARQFQHHDLISLVSRVLESTGLDPSALFLEVTESALTFNSGSVSDTLHKLKELGVNLTLEDFGTGYSSLSYVRRIPLDVLKIDRVFIHEVTNNAADASIARAIIAVAGALNIRTIAEGVETEGQLNFVKVNHCDVVQGDYFSRPLSVADITALLRRGGMIDAQAISGKA